MNKLFIVFFAILGICICLFITSIIPLKIVGENIIKKAKKHNIEIISNESWTINPITLRGKTNKIEYNINVGNSNIKGYGDNFTCSLINGDAFFEKIVLEIYIDENENLRSIFENLKKNIVSKYFSLEAKNLSISIFLKNTTESQVDLIEEFLINDLVITKHKNTEIYKASIGINKNEKMTIMTTIDRPNTERYELNTKIENSNFFCYIYDSKRNGTINCLNRDAFTFIKQISDIEIDNNFIKKILSKQISLKADILHNQKLNDGVEIVGNLIINNDIGHIKYDGINNIVSLKFDKIDLDSTLNDIQNAEDDVDIKETYDDIISMSGKENKFLSSAKKIEQSENINSLKKILTYIMETFNAGKINTNISIKQTTIDTVPVQNVNIDISKVNEQIDIKNISANFGEKLNGKILITNQKDQDRNLFISGDSLPDFLKLFNINLLKKNINSLNYYVLGKIDLSTSSIELQNLSYYVDKTKIFDFDMSKTYSYKQKQIISNEHIKIQNIDINKYFNISSFYQNLYELFNSLQQEEKQDALFWKYLFKKRNKNDFFKSFHKIITINDSLIYDKKVKYFVLDYKDDSKNTDITAITDGELCSGQLYFNLKNIDNKETITSKIDIKNLNLNQQNSQFFNDIKTATNRDLSDIFYADKDYNIPSMIGLNGLFELNIDNISYNNKLFTDINGQIDLNNGIFTAENLRFRYKNGEVNSNMAFSLQGRPELQFAIAGSGFYLSDISNTQVNGRISFQVSLKTFGFNPVKFTKEISGNGHIIVQNIVIPKFDLLHMSSELLTNGIRPDYNYMDIVNKKPLVFSKGEGDVLIENGVSRGELSFARELVSGRLVFEYDLFNNVLNQLTGSFATMITKKRGSTPFPIYIPFACSGGINKQQCVINWDQFNEVISSSKS